MYRLPNVTCYIVSLHFTFSFALSLSRFVALSLLVGQGSDKEVVGQGKEGAAAWSGRPLNLRAARHVRCSPQRLLVHGSRIHLPMHEPSHPPRSRAQTPLMLIQIVWGSGFGRHVHINYPFNRTHVPYVNSNTPYIDSNRVHTRSIIHIRPSGLPNGGVASSSSYPPIVLHFHIRKWGTSVIE